MKIEGSYFILSSDEKGITIKQHPRLKGELFTWHVLRHFLRPGNKDICPVCGDIMQGRTVNTCNNPNCWELEK